MCGELDDDAVLGDELYDHLQLLARRYPAADGDASRLDAFDDTTAPEAAHHYMDRLFADLLKMCIDDSGEVSASHRVDVMMAQSVVFARLAGLIAGQLPPSAETLRNGIEALMDGYNERDRAPPSHSHHH